MQYVHETEKKMKKETKNHFNLINLRERYLPYANQIPQMEEEDLFIHLEDNLIGKEVVGDLSPLVYNGYYIYFHYSEDTFDEKYKNMYPTFFLASNAPIHLKSLFYNPRCCSYINENGKNYLYFRRTPLDFSQYIEYYEFLKGKYLGNFYIEPKEKLIIQLVEQFGLEEARNIVENAVNSSQNFYALVRSRIENNREICYNPYPELVNVSTEKEVNRILAIIKRYDFDK